MKVGFVGLRCLRVSVAPVARIVAIERVQGSTDIETSATGESMLTLPPKM